MIEDTIDPKTGRKIQDRQSFIEQMTAHVMADKQSEMADRQAWIDQTTKAVMAEPNPTLLERGANTAKSIVGSAIAGTGKFLEGTADALYMANPLSVDISRIGDPEGQVYAQPPAGMDRSLPAIAGQGIASLAPETDPRMQHDFWSQKLPGFLGGLGPFVGSKALFGPLGEVTMLAAQGGAAAREDALANGADEGTANTAFWLSAGVNASLAPVLGKMFTGWDSLAGGGVSAAFKRTAAAGATGASFGVAARMLGNAIHNYATDDEKSLLEGVGEDAVLMGTGGALLGTAMEIARGLKGQPRQPTSEQDLIDAAKSFEVRAPSDPVPAYSEVKQTAIHGEDVPPEPALGQFAEKPVTQSDLPADPQLGQFKAPPEPEPIPKFDPAVPEQDYSRAQQLLDKPISELRTTLTTLLRAEDAQLRQDFPGKSDSWYETVYELRRKARDPFNLEGDKAALELKRLGVKPQDAPRGFRVEEYADAIREKVRAAEAGAEAGKRAYAEKGRGAATAARAEAEQEHLDGAVERVGQGPSYHPSGIANSPSNSKGFSQDVSQSPTTARVEIGGGLTGSLTNALPEGVAPTRKQNVINAMVDILRAAGSNSPLLQGRIPASARGLFDALPNLAKIQKWGDLYAASHEVGHALERAVFGYDPAKSPWKGDQNQAAINRAAQKELSKLGKDLYGPVKPNGGYLREGFAEYVRMWLTDPNEVMKRAPAFTQWFDRQFLPSLDPSIMKAMEAARTQADAWRAQGAYKRAENSYQWAGTLDEKLKRAYEWSRQMVSLHAWEDGSRYAKVFDREMAKGLRRPLKGDESLTQAIAGNRARAAGIVEQFMHNAVTTLDGTTLGPSLKQIFAPVQNQYRPFMLYLWAKRTLALADMVAQHPEDPNQLIATPKDSGMSVEDAHQLISEIETKYPAMPKTAADFYEWNTNVNKYVESVDPEMGRVLLSMDKAQEGLHPGGWESNYVVLHRAMDGMDAWARKRRGTNSAGRVMKLTDALQGSGREVKDILPEMLKQVQSRIEAAHMRIPHNVVADAADFYPEAASHLVHLASPEDQLRLQSHFDAAKQPLVGRGEATGDALDVFGSAMSFFAEPHLDSGGKEVTYPIWRPEMKNEAGEVVRPAGLVAYSMNADLYTAMMHMRAEQLTGKLANAGRWSRNVVVLGATGLSMPFGLVKNPMRDVNMFVLNTKYYANPIVALSQWSRYSIYSLFDALSNGYLHSKMQDPMYERYSQVGLEMNQSYQMNAGRGENAIKHSRELFQTTGRRAINPTSILDYAAKIVSATEKAGRIAEMKGALKEIGWDGKRSLTPDEIQQAVIASRQVTIDYTQAGELAQKINQVIPFFNSSIQGPVAMLRGAKHHPWRFAALVATQTAAGMALWNLHKDEKWYQELPLDERARAWHTTAKIDGQDTIVRWYKPQEIGMLQSVVEELTDAVYHNRAIRGSDLWHSLVDQGLPSIMPPALTEAYAQAANYDFRTGRRIIADSKVNLAAAGYAYEQSNENTSRAADIIGHWTHTSPSRVDHFMRTFFGGSGQDIMNGIFGANTKGREWEAADAPVLGIVARRGGTLNPASQSLIDFYRLLDISDGITKSEEHPATPEQERIHKMLVDYGAGIAAMSYVRSTYLKTNAERSKAMEEIVDYAREAVQAANSNTWNPAGGAIARQVGTTRRTIADLNNGKLPRNMR